MVAEKIWRDIKISADKLCAPGQKPFLILDKAPAHVGKKSQAELDEWWGKGNWMFQAGKMPDSNDGDVAVFPFMKRTIAGLRKASYRSEGNPGLRKEGEEAIDTRGVQEHDTGSRSAQHGDRQGRRQELLRRVNDEKNDRPVDIVFCFYFKRKNKHGVFLGASRAIMSWF